MQQDALPPLHSLPFYSYTMQCVIKMPDIYCRILSRRCCHLQLNRGAAHLEINIAVNSRSRVPVLQLSRGAMASHFCHWARPAIPHVGAHRQARSPSYMARTAVWSLRWPTRRTLIAGTLIVQKAPELLRRMF